MTVSTAVAVAVDIGEHVFVIGVGGSKGILTRNFRQVYGPHAGQPEFRAPAISCGARIFGVDLDLAVVEDSAGR